MSNDHFAGVSSCDMSADGKNEATEFIFMAVLSLLLLAWLHEQKRKVSQVGCVDGNRQLSPESHCLGAKSTFIMIHRIH